MIFGLFNKITDPVCRMKINKKEAQYSSDYKDEKYYFCSKNCLDNFSKEPEKYIVKQENSTSSCCR